MKKRNNNKLIITIFIIALFFRIFFLIASPFSATDADEAINGITAKHILEGKAFPFPFLRGQSYGTGVLLQSYLATIPSLILGPNDLALKVTIVSESLIILLISYLFIKKYFNKKIALIASMLIAVPPPIIMLFNSHIGYHLEAVLLKYFFMNK
jgi:4-amino-4-deoxy-L-arabinose transferase-like glycosyltransferase